MRKQILSILVGIIALALVGCTSTDQGASSASPSAPEQSAADGSLISDKTKG